MARGIGARAEVRAYSASSAIPQANSGRMGLGGGRVLEELGNGQETVSRGTFRGAASNRKRAGLVPLDPMAGSILMSPRPPSTSSRIGRVAVSEIPGRG